MTPSTPDAPNTPHAEVEEVLAAIRRLIVEGPARPLAAASPLELFLLDPSMRVDGRAGPQPAGDLRRVDPPSVQGSAEEDVSIAGNLSAMLASAAAFDQSPAGGASVDRLPSNAAADPLPGAALTISPLSVDSTSPSSEPADPPPNRSAPMPPPPAELAAPEPFLLDGALPSVGGTEPLLLRADSFPEPLLLGDALPPSEPSDLDAVRPPEGFPASHGPSLPEDPILRIEPPLEPLLLRDMAPSSEPPNPDAALPPPADEPASDHETPDLPEPLPLPPLLLGEAVPSSGPWLRDPELPSSDGHLATSDIEPRLLQAEPYSSEAVLTTGDAATAPIVEAEGERLGADVAPGPGNPPGEAAGLLPLGVLILRAEPPPAEDASLSTLILGDPLPHAEEPLPPLLLEPAPVNRVEPSSGPDERGDGLGPPSPKLEPSPEPDAPHSTIAAAPDLAPPPPAPLESAGIEEPFAVHLPSEPWPEPPSAAGFLAEAPATMRPAGGPLPVGGMAKPEIDNASEEPLPSLHLSWEDPEAQARPRDPVAPWEDLPVKPIRPDSPTSRHQATADSAMAPQTELQAPADRAPDAVPGTVPWAESPPQALVSERHADADDALPAASSSGDDAVFAAVLAAAAVPVLSLAPAPPERPAAPPLGEADLRALVADLVREQVLRELPALRDSIRQELMEALRDPQRPL